ncbi:MAG: holo-[acyl-carrier-protein] synthase [Phycisphaerales bacterium]|nr:holo-[acyl-carrier-protein] synthase [Phycisphaerales bacterium]
MIAHAHGIDLVEVSRIDRMLSDHGERFLERVFTVHERGDCDATPSRRAERLAARFAVKEAALKALGTGWRSGIAWTDVETRLEPSGAPVLHLHGRARELAAEQGLARWMVSISHAGGLATASVIGCRAAQ